MIDICCHHCHSAYIWTGRGSAIDGARVAGWIVWEGATLGGKQVKRTYCPRCSGKPVIDPTTGKEPSWDARCSTCDAQMGEERDDGDRPITKEDAEQWRSDHHCWPDVELIAPVKEVAAR